MKQSCNKKEKNIYIFLKGEKLEKKNRKTEKHFNN
jgi:hypothetical protein